MKDVVLSEDEFDEVDELLNGYLDLLEYLGDRLTHSLDVIKHKAEVHIRRSGNEI